jgi:Family of unknown function (DUF5760)
MENFREAMSSWVELKTQLKEARKDLSVLNKREKELRSFIKTYMGKEEIDIVNVDKNKVKYIVRNGKGSITREVIKNGLMAYFGNDEVKCEGAFQAILDAVPNVKKETLTLV